MLCSFGVFHPLKMSTGVVRETPKGLFVRVKLFADDFENRLNEISKRKINLTDGVNDYEQKCVLHYVNQHLLFELNDAVILMSEADVKMIESGLVVQVEMQYDVDRKTKENVLRISNDLMFEVFDNQRNSMVVKTSDKALRLDFNHSDFINEIRWNK